MGEKNGPMLKYTKKGKSQNEDKPAKNKWDVYKDAGRKLAYGAVTLATAVSVGLATGSCKDNDGNGTVDAGDATPLDGSMLDAALDGGDLLDGSVVDSTVTDGGVQPGQCEKTKNAVAHLNVSANWSQYGNKCEDAAGGCLAGAKVGDSLTVSLGDTQTETWTVNEVLDNLVRLGNGNAVIEVSGTSSHYNSGNGQWASTESTGRGSLRLLDSCTFGECMEVNERAGMSLLEVTYNAETRRVLMAEGETETVDYNGGAVNGGVTVNLTLRMSTNDNAYVTWEVNNNVQSDSEPLTMPLGQGENHTSLDVTIANVVSTESDDVANSSEDCVTKSIVLLDDGAQSPVLSEGDTFVTQHGVELEVARIMVEAYDGLALLSDCAVKLVRVSDGEEIILRGGETQQNLNGGSVTFHSVEYTEVQPVAPDADAGI